MKKEEEIKPLKTEKLHKNIQMKRKTPVSSQEKKPVLKEKNSILNEGKITEKKMGISKEKAALLIKTENKEKKPVKKHKELQNTKENAEKTEELQKELKKTLQKPFKKTKKIKISSEISQEKNQEKTEKADKNQEKLEKKPLKKRRKKRNGKKKSAKKALKPDVFLMKSLEKLEKNPESSEMASMSKLLFRSLEEFKGFFQYFPYKTHLKARKMQIISNKKLRILASQEKIHTQILRNSEIRQSNLERFLNKQDIDPFSSKNFKPPWGLDQQKFRRYYLSRFLKEFNINQELPRATVQNEVQKQDL